MFLQRQAVQHTRAGEECLIRTRPRRSDDNGVDEARHTIEACRAGCNDEGALCCGAGLVVESWVVAPYEHADDQYGEDVECSDADKYPFTRLGDRDAGIARLRRRHSETLRAGEAEHRICHACPISEEAAPRAGGDELDERAGVLPVSKADSRCTGDAAEINNQTEKDEKDDEDDLEESEPELDFAVDANEAQAYGHGESDEDHDPEGGVDVRPVLEEDADGCDFRGDGEAVAVN